MFDCRVLEKEAENLFYIIDYAKLKGVWNRALYPIIWYYKKETLKEANELSGTDEEILDFKDSFIMMKLMGTN